MPGLERRFAPSPAAVVAAFGAVYLIWGSTYLAIRYAIETLPGFLMAGTRYLVAGTVVYAWARGRAGERPSLLAWREAALLGALFFLGGNGAVVWAESRVPSGFASLLVATMPLWVVLLDWARPRGHRPAGVVVVGLALGFGGLVLLVHPARLGGPATVDRLGAAVLVLGAFCWALGSLYSRHATLPRSLPLSSGMEMMCGGGWLLLVGAASGQVSHLHLRAISPRSLLALGYLVFFGSIVAFNAFKFLLEVSTPSRVATYAYVNPVVAVLLGWTIAGEPLTGRTIAGAAVILSSVAIVTAGNRPPSLAPEDESVAEIVEHSPAP